MTRLPAAAALLVCAALLAGCSDASAADRDGDGIPDVQEASGWDIEVTALDGTVTARRVTSDPRNRTTDGSALADTYKYAFGLDPRLLDTDGDGLTDCQEVYDRSLAHCQPGYAGATDGGHKTAANKADTDGDGASDGAEVLGRDVPLPGGAVKRVTTDPRRTDSDGDGLLDGHEPPLGADPTDADTDDDGCHDGLDAFPAADARFRAGLLNLTWRGSQPAQLRFLLAVGGLPQQWPAIDQPAIQAQPGQTVSLAGLPQPLLQATCSFRPQAPWLNLQLVPYWMDAPGGQRPVEVRAAAAGEGGHTAYYNPRSGLVAADVAGTGATPLPLRLEGPEATLLAHPAATDSAGQILKENNQNS